jgi:ribonucleoside-diphosphate reductase alpha chain
MQLEHIGRSPKSFRRKIKYFDGSIAQITEIPEVIRNRYKEVFEINPKWIIKSAAYRGKWIDQSQSINIYFRGTSGKDLSEVYMYAWELGLKTTYYLRTLAVSQVEKSTVDTKQFGSTHTRNYLGVGGTVSEPESTASVNIAPSATPASIKACSIVDPTCESCQA